MSSSRDGGKGPRSGTGTVLAGVNLSKDLLADVVGPGAGGLTCSGGLATVWGPIRFIHNAHIWNEPVQSSRLSSLASAVATKATVTPARHVVAILDYGSEAALALAQSVVFK